MLVLSNPLHFLGDFVIAGLVAVFAAKSLLAAQPGARRLSAAFTNIPRAGTDVSDNPGTTTHRKMLWIRVIGLVAGWCRRIGEFWPPICSGSKSAAKTRR